MPGIMPKQSTLKTAYLYMRQNNFAKTCTIKMLLATIGQSDFKKTGNLEASIRIGRDEGKSLIKKLDAFFGHRLADVFTKHGKPIPNEIDFELLKNLAQDHAIAADLFYPVYGIVLGEIFYDLTKADAIPMLRRLLTISQTAEEAAAILEFSTKEAVEAFKRHINTISAQPLPTEAAVSPSFQIALEMPDPNKALYAKLKVKNNTSTSMRMILTNFTLYETEKCSKKELYANLKLDYHQYGHCVKFLEYFYFWQYESLKKDIQENGFNKDKCFDFFAHLDEKLNDTFGKNFLDENICTLVFNLYDLRYNNVNLVKFYSIIKDEGIDSICNHIKISSTLDYKRSESNSDGLLAEFVRDIKLVKPASAPEVSTHKRKEPELSENQNPSLLQNYARPKLLSPIPPTDAFRLGQYSSNFPLTETPYQQPGYYAIMPQTLQQSAFIPSQPNYPSNRPQYFQASSPTHSQPSPFNYSAMLQSPQMPAFIPSQPNYPSNRPQYLQASSPTHSQPSPYNYGAMLQSPQQSAFIPASPNYPGNRPQYYQASSPTHSQPSPYNPGATLQSPQQPYSPSLADLFGMPPLSSPRNSPLPAYTIPNVNQDTLPTDLDVYHQDIPFLFFGNSRDDRVPEPWSMPTPPNKTSTTPTTMTTTSTTTTTTPATIPTTTQLNADQTSNSVLLGPWQGESVLDPIEGYNFTEVVARDPKHQGKRPKKF